MSVEKKVPEIRFKGFSGEWEPKTLGSSVSYIKGFAFKSNDYEDNGVRIVRVSDLTKNSLSELSSKIYISSSKESLYSNYMINGGDIVITTVGSKAEMRDSAVGRAIIFTKSEGLLLNQNLVKVTPAIANDSQFIYNQLLREQYAKFIEDIQRGNANQANIAIGDLWEYSLNFPKVKEEQTQIGHTFQKLDNLINQHQQKHDQLSNIKKAMLEKMFPKPGETIPEIRFKGFSGEWQVVSLSDFGVATSGTSIESEFTKDGKYKVISIGSYSESSVYTEQGIRASLSPKTESRVLNKNDLTMILNDKTLAGNIIGRVLLINEDDSYIYNQRTQRIEPSSEYDPQFLYQFLNAPLVRKKIFKSSQGNTQIYVNWSAISKLKYLLPKKDEQTAIGNYFQKLDALINQHQQQITKLTHIKQSFLSKMFV